MGEEKGFKGELVEGQNTPQAANVTLHSQGHLRYRCRPIKTGQIQ